MGSESAPPPLPADGHSSERCLCRLTERELYRVMDGLIQDAGCLERLDRPFGVRHEAPAQRVVLA